MDPKLPIVVYSSRALELASGIRTNGLITRLSSWQQTLFAIEILHISEKNNFRKTEDFKENRIIVDLTGENLISIIKAAWGFRGRNAICFRQDSQFRYFLGQFRVKLNLATIKTAVNIFRAFTRELAAATLFSKAGYVTKRDFLICSRSFEFALLQSSLNYAKCKSPRIPDTISSICVVANFQYGPNVDGLRELLHSNALTKTLLRHNIKLIFKGNRAKTFADSLEKCQRGVVDIEACSGFDSWEDIQSPNQIYLAPAMYGSGIKNKIIEAQLHDGICFAWKGFENEFAYDPFSVAYYKNAFDLTDLIDFLITWEDKSHTFFEIMETYKLEKAFPTNRLVN